MHCVHDDSDFDSIASSENQFLLHLNLNVVIYNVAAKKKNPVVLG